MMKPTFSLRTLTQFSLRTLLVASTLAAIGLAYVGNRLFERRQERFVDEVLRDEDWEIPVSVGYSDGKVSLGLIGGEHLSEATARKIVAAKRIAWISIHKQTLPSVHDILAEEFVEQQHRWKGYGGDWYRQGGEARPANAEVWEIIAGEKKSLKASPL